MGRASRSAGGKVEHEVSVGEAVGLGAKGPPGSAIDPRDAEPLYLQIAHRLSSDITRGVLAPGGKLPSEAELMRTHGVSRVTVRQAVQRLTASGQVTPQRGKGTYVTRSQVQLDLGTLQGFQDALRSQGIEPETTLVEFGLDAGRPHTPGDAAAQATLPVGVQLPVRLRRLYSVAGKPFAVVEGWLPASAAVLGEERARQMAIYEILQQFLGIRIARADVAVLCAPASARVARELGVARRTNVLVMQRTSFNVSGVACEHVRIHIAPEQYTFRLSLPGPLEIVRSLRPTQAVAATG